MRQYDLIISLTTWKGRINDPALPLVLYRLLAQQEGNKKYKVVLVLSEEEFGKDFKLPKNLDDFTKQFADKFEILWTYTNTRALKKLDPTMQKYPDEYIVTMDDDELMSPYTVDYLCKEIAARPRMILGAFHGKGEMFNGIDFVCGIRVFPPHSLGYINPDYFKTYFQYMQDDEWNGLRARVGGTELGQLKSSPIMNTYFGDQSVKFENVYKQFDFKGALKKFFTDHPEFKQGDDNFKIYIAGSSQNHFLKLPNYYEPYFVDIKREGDYIDNLNPWYCEITALYNIWKHATEDIVGLCHYRRYFIHDNHIMTKDDAEKLLNNHDIIMYKWSDESAFDAMTNTGKLDELKLAINLIEKTYGKEMHDFIEDKMKTKGVYEGNMFICHKELIDEYCEFLFPLLAKFDEVHKFRINRIDGYIAEYLFGPWMQWKQKKIYDCPRVTFDRNLQYVLKGHV